jgi:hypothetical protein
MSFLPFLSFFLLLDLAATQKCTQHAPQMSNGECSTHTAAAASYIADSCPTRHMVSTCRDCFVPHKLKDDLLLKPAQPEPPVLKLLAVLLLFNG